MQKYDQYKNSGMEWLGDIPEHWEVKRFKHISNIQKGKLPRKIVSTNELNLPPYMSMEYLRGGEENQWVLDREAKIIDKNKTLLLWDGSNAGEFIKSRNGVISSTVAEIEFKNIHHNFAWFYSKFLEIELRKKTIGMGIPHVNGTELKNFSVALPPINEQILIANFLEDKTIKIDQAIVIKQKQIELLKERRQILIHKAVTRGLDDDVKLKDSGVEWIGKIPEHWEVNSKMKFISSMKGRQGWQGLKANEYTEEGPHVLSSAHFNNYIIDWTKCPRVSMKRYLMDENIQLRVGDILLMKDGANMGKLAFVENLPGLTCLNSHLLLFRPLLKNNKSYYFPKYMFYHMMCQEFQDYVRINGTGSTFLGISQESIGNYNICLPPYSEQIQIADFIETAITKIATTISLKQEEIEKLKEYKMSLIDGVVTGKVRVS